MAETVKADYDSSTLGGQISRTHSLVEELADAVKWLEEKASDLLHDAGAGIIESPDREPLPSAHGRWLHSANEKFDQKIADLRALINRLDG